jgi:MFS family permease
VQQLLFMHILRTVQSHHLGAVFYRHFCTLLNNLIYSSRIFSLFGGLVFAGFAFGPSVGGLLISISRHVLSVFYVSALMHLVLLCFFWFVVPESLSRKQMIANRKKHVGEGEKGLGWKTFFGFLRPLRIFFPPGTGRGSTHLFKDRDWNMALFAVGYACSVAVIVIPSNLFCALSRKTENEISARRE